MSARQAFKEFLNISGKNAGTLYKNYISYLQNDLGFETRRGANYVASTTIASAIIGGSFGLSVAIDECKNQHISTSGTIAKTVAYPVAGATFGLVTGPVTFPLILFVSAKWAN